MATITEFLEAQPVLGASIPNGLKLPTALRAILALHEEETGYRGQPQCAQCAEAQRADWPCAASASSIPPTRTDSCSFPNGTATSSRGTSHALTCPATHAHIARSFTPAPQETP